MGKRQAACARQKICVAHHNCLSAGLLLPFSAPSAAATSPQDLELDADELRDKLKSKINDFNADISAMMTQRAQQYAALAEKVHQEQAAIDEAHQSGKKLASVFKMLDVYYDDDPELAAKSAETERSTDALHQRATAAHDEALKAQARSDERVRSVLQATTDGLNKMKADLDHKESEMGRKLIEMSAATDLEGKVKAYEEVVELYFSAFNAVQADFARRTAYASKDRWA